MPFDIVIEREKEDKHGKFQKNVASDGRTELAEIPTIKMYKTSVSGLNEGEKKRILVTADADRDHFSENAAMLQQEKKLHMGAGIHDSPLIKTARQQLESSYQRAEALASMKFNRHVYRKELKHLDNARRGLIAASNSRAHAAKFDSTGVLLQSLTPRTTSDCIDQALKYASTYADPSQAKEDLFRLADMCDNDPARNAGTISIAERAHINKATSERIDAHAVEVSHNTDFV
jgi:hypothetical protein